MSFYVLSCTTDLTLFLALAVWRFKISQMPSRLILLSTAFLAMALWAGMHLLGGLFLNRLADAIRNFFWLAYICITIGYASPQEETGSRSVFFLLLVVAALRVALGFTLPFIGMSYVVDYNLALSVYDLVFCVATLIVVNSLYFSPTTLSSGFRLILICLAMLWAYDLNFYTMVVLGNPVDQIIAYGRPTVALLLSPVFALSARRKEQWTIGLSRQATFQTVALVIIGGYFVLVSLASRLFDVTTLGFSISVWSLALVVAVTTAMIIALSAPVRNWFKGVITKGLFVHRYDYREEWLRFNATINGGRLSDLTPEQRAIKAVADVMGCTKGRALLLESSGTFREVANYKWPGSAILDDIQIGSDVVRAMTVQSSIIQFGEAPDRVPVPDAMRCLSEIWIGVPLIRANSLIGTIVLNKPLFHRELDWEDLAILKVLGQQIATYLTDSQTQRELEQAKQFDEFNRRFAFIVHDIKNVVSQLAMVSVNAKTHIENPRFQQALTVTLSNSVSKMNVLLQRLAEHRNEDDVPQLELLDISALLRDLVATRQGQHPIALEAPQILMAVGELSDLRIALDHVLQNAIEASPPESTIQIRTVDDDSVAQIEIIDTGAGMSAEFVRNELFKPFSSTKRNGFGIGAGEARDLIERMHGRMSVRTEEGFGSTFVIRLKKALVSEEEPN